MNEIKQAALGICVLAAAAGLLRMLIPCEKYKLQITFAIACIFSVCLINSVTDVIPALTIETKIADIPQVDFSDKLSEQARVTAARAVRKRSRSYSPRTDLFTARCILQRILTARSAYLLVRSSLYLMIIRTMDTSPMLYHLYSRQSGTI